MMASTWHRTEPREVRPFFAAIDAEAALDGSGISLTDGGDVLTDASFDLDEVDFQKLEPVVHVALAGIDAWLPSGLDRSDVDLVLIARHPFLKRSDIISRTSLENDVPKEISVDRATLDEFGGGRNLQLTLAICLTEDKPPVPGSPFVPGHWLGKKSFHLRSRSMPTLFDLRTRTDAEWVAAKFPAKTFFSVDYAGGIAGEAEDGSSVATVYVHIDAHNKMVSSPIGQALQPLLAVEIILTILLQSFPDWKSLDAISATCPLSTLAKQLGGAKPLMLPELKSLVNDGSRLRAQLQDCLGVVRAL